jgi:hypothetical protein
MQPSLSKQPPPESGETLHRRESLWQIFLPFGLGLLFILILVLMVALPSDPIWRIRAQAIADFTYIMICQLPIFLCAFATFIPVALGIWGMYRVHGTTERPLRKLENLSAGLAERINRVSDYINQKTIDASVAIEPALNMISPFDTPLETNEEASDAGTEQ